ncbi:MAG: 16S rRNA (cytosine(967)-C(5))-methyltransferase RsmB [Deferrisomatales bacterium]|nr:16S rRNA (cytosine(967)-C(5))-methyltransferase RsmB [Deferrisomatales bacterium]
MSHTPTPRALALDVLTSLERRDAYADVLLNAALDRAPAMAARDRALASNLVYGVLRWRNRLDYHLARFCRQPLKKLHPKVLHLLRLGAYQILFLDRVPDRAAVSEAVALAHYCGQPAASGLVNAVLRRVAEAGPGLSETLSPVERLSLLFGCPGWLVERWLAEHGPEGAESLCRGASRVPQLWLRIDPRRLPREAALARLHEAGIEAFPGAFAPEAVGLSGGDPRANPLVREGLAVVQDQASQLIARWLSPEPGWRVLDGCAAPGLKATHLAVMVGDTGAVEALDLHPHRVAQVKELAARVGCGNCSAKLGDARTHRWAKPFDAVLVDAPCSGLGVLRRTPEAKWRRSAGEMDELPALQGELLGNLADAVRPGGVLVYATCTTARAENEAVVEAFLAQRPDFRVSPPPAGPVDWRPLVGADGFLRTYPGGVDGTGPAALDGFFAARLRRETAR